MAGERELVKLSSGCSLETKLYSPEIPTSQGSTGLAILLHPWSWLGGRMEDQVLVFLSDILLHECGYHVLLFNSRGTGKSSGWPSFTGLTEGKDLEELVQWGLGAVPDVKSVVLIGYSHGALITSLHPVLPAPIKTSHLLLSYPLGPRSFLTLFRGGTYIDRLNTLINDPQSNVLIVHGDQDEFTSAEAYEGWVTELRRNEGEFRVELIQGATHFWFSRSGQRLRDIVKGWVPDLV
ncbi:alpha/beta-hydrolase [Thelephora ganbajun]|uniref:Alpha/beta-hydrolase n=1 Tax=Thelephora ganbajun TaxID=370292 RepID=A0ACB6ZI32_THEGA|nr:alpha/beta-hydrolase [Thelephora ganbajun]